MRIEIKKIPVEEYRFKIYNLITKDNPKGENVFILEQKIHRMLSGRLMESAWEICKEIPETAITVKAVAL